MECEDIKSIIDNFDNMQCMCIARKYSRLGTKVRYQYSINEKNINQPKQDSNNRRSILKY